MSRPWTIIVGPDSVSGDFLIRIAPEGYDGPGLLLATPCSDLEEAESFSRRVDCFLDQMAEGLIEGDLDGEPIGDLRSWFTCYYDLRFYLRLIPACMDTEDAGYSHGLSIDGMFATTAEANAAADAAAAELSSLLESLVAKLEDEDPLARALAELVPQSPKSIM